MKHCRPNGRRFIQLRRLLAVWLAAGLLFCPVSMAEEVEEATVLIRFKEFTNAWMTKLDNACQANKKAIEVQHDDDGYFGEYVCYGPNTNIRIKKTKSTATPYVGFLSYTEKRIVKKGRTAQEVGVDNGRVSSKMITTEIFRYTNGKWVF